MGQSRNEDILESIVNSTEYTDPPRSRIEDLLLQVKGVIEEGGSGTTDYDDLSNKPRIGGVTLSGNKSASDLSLASLDANGKVPAAQLPSYVDDVINGYLYEGHFYEDSAHTTEITGESGKIYVDLETNKTYRWSGLAFVEISESLALGETASTAYAGDKGKANADAITAIKDGQTIDSFGDVETALNGKQASLSAGDYIDIDENEISVQRVNVDDVNVTYSCSSGTITFVKKIGTETIDTLSVNINNYTPPVDVFGLYTLSDSQYSLYFKLENKVASDEHAVGYSDNIYSLSYDAVTEHFHIEDTDNKLVIKSEMDNALSNKQDTLTFDDVPTDNSNNPVKSNGIYDALATKADLTDLAPAFSTETAYTVGQYVSYNGNVYKCTSAHSAGAWVAGDFTLVAVGSELESKQDTLTFDDTPTQNSTNPVKSGGVYSALGEKADTDIVASDFDATASYTAGNYCIYEGKFYKFKANHSGAWSAADVDEIKIAGELSALKSGLTNVNSDLLSKVGRINTDVEAPIRTNLFDKDNKIREYKYYDGTSWHDVSAGTWQTIFVPVIGGLTYTASGFPAQGGVKTVFTTGDKTTVLADYSAADNNQTFTAPSNAEYIGFGIYSPNANYDSAKFEIGSTATAYTAYTPSVNERLEAVESAVQTKTSIASASIDGSNAVEINVTNLTSYDFVVCGVSYYDTGIANYGFVMIPVSEFLLFSDSGTKIFFSKTGGGVSFVDVKSDNNRTKLTFTPESGVTPTGRYYFVHGIKTR